MADWFSIAAQVGGAVSSFLGNKKAASSQKASSKSIKKALEAAAADSLTVRKSSRDQNEKVFVMLHSWDGLIR